MSTVVACAETKVTHEALCPSCGQHSTFTYEGDQRIPLKVAEKLGLPSVVPLWSCGACGTTLSEGEIRG